MHWSRWGDPDAAAALPEPARALVEMAFGPLEPQPSIGLGDVHLPALALPAAAHDDLVRLLGAEHVRTDDESRIRHTRGKSTPDLLRIRAGDAGDAPDAVLLPASHDEVGAVLDICARHRVAVVPFGGGTSVVGGLAARRNGLDGVIALDLRRLDRLVSVDPESGTAVLEAGVRGPDAERMLAEHGLTLGHFPQSFEYATIGGFAATRSSGQASAGYGRFDALCVGVRVATPRGDLVLGTAPASAAGPDLRQLVLGSEGALGVITEVTVRVRQRPVQTSYEGWRFGSFDQGCRALRAVTRSCVRPTVLRLSDEAETALNLAKPDDVGGAGVGGCLMVVGLEGSPDELIRQRSDLEKLLTGHQGVRLDPAEGEAWAAARFRSPYLRDSLLDVGILVETLETATFWSRLRSLYDGVRAALETTLGAGGAPAVVVCHVSHVYETGASLYFTVAARQAEDPVAQWQRSKAAASQAIVDAGGTITHHHAVGRDHLPWLAAEIGEVGIGVLRAVKRELDPDGILNPGVLIPEPSKGSTGQVKADGNASR